MKKLFFILLAMTFLTSPAFAATSTTNAELEAQIKTILTKNPDLILNVIRDNKELLVDLVQQGADSKRRQLLLNQWQEDSKTSKKVTIENRPTRGEETAPVTLIAFSDFTCSYCMQAAVTVENLLKRYNDKVRFVFKQFPSDAPAALEASRWFLAANKQDSVKGWNFYANLFSKQKEFFAKPAETLKEVAALSELDVKALEADLKKNLSVYDAIINEDIAEAKKLGFTGTPYFLVNDLVIRGALPLENFSDAVEFALKQKN